MSPPIDDDWVSGEILAWVRELSYPDRPAVAQSIAQSIAAKVAGLPRKKKKKKKTMATPDQMDTIESRRIDDTARKMMIAGVTLTWSQSYQIGAGGHGWLRDLGLSKSVADEDGVTYTPTA